MSKAKRIGVAAGAGMGAATAVALRRRWSRRPAEEAPEAPGAIGRAFLDHLAEAIRIPTVSHEDWGRVDESQWGRFREFLQATYPTVFERLEWEVIAGQSLLFRWEGADHALPPILLMGHYDVVPVEPATEDDWPHPPFDAVEADGFLWGRGAMDDKGAVIALFEAVERLLVEGFRPETTIFLAVGHDEEVGGTRGARVVAEALAERGVRFEFVLDEGGAVGEDLLPGLRAPVALIGVGEKGYLNVEISASGDGGHSSTPPAHTAVGRVAAAITALEENPMPARVEVQAGLFATLAEGFGFRQRFVLRRARRFHKTLERRLEGSPMANALIRTTAAAVMVEGGVKPNVLPQQARAVLNFRILQGDSIDSVLQHVRRVVGDDVTVQPVEEGFTSEPSQITDTSAGSYRVLTDAIDDVFPGVLPAPWILMGATDSRYFAPITDAIYRFVPFRARPEDLGRIHGTGERIRVADADTAVRFYDVLIRRAAGA
jgi:carboxypeptidase PM20D1